MANPMENRPCPKAHVTVHGTVDRPVQRAHCSKRCEICNGKHYVRTCLACGGAGMIPPRDVCTVCHGNGVTPA